MTVNKVNLSTYETAAANYIAGNCDDGSLETSTLTASLGNQAQYLDQDGDGEISSNEMEAFYIIADTNNDGTVSDAERQNALNSLSQPKGQNLLKGVLNFVKNLGSTGTTGLSISQTTDASGNTSLTEYSSTGATLETDIYNSSGNIREKDKFIYKDGKKLTEKDYYDSNNYLFKSDVMDSTGKKVDTEHIYTRDRDGNLLTDTVLKGTTTTSTTTYDPTTHQISKTTAINGKTTTETNYTTDGKPSTVTITLKGKSTPSEVDKYTYDQSGNCTLTKYKADGTTAKEKLYYDANGNLSKDDLYNSTGTFATTSSTYNTSTNKISKKEIYNTSDKLSETDTYDANGTKTGVEKYTYKNGNLSVTNKYDAKGKTILETDEWKYDSSGNRSLSKQTLYKLDTSSASTVGNKLSSSVNLKSTVSYEVKEVNADGTYTVSFYNKGKKCLEKDTYNADGTPLTATAYNSTGTTATTSCTFATDGSISSTTNSTYKNGKLATATTLDSSGRTTAVKTYKSGTLSTVDNYSYNSNGTLSSVVRNDSSNNIVGQADYTYDSITGNLSNVANYDSSNNLVGQASYTYSSSGNLSAITFYKNGKIAEKDEYDSTGTTVTKKTKYDSNGNVSSTGVLGSNATTVNGIGINPFFGF